MFRPGKSEGKVLFLSGRGLVLLAAARRIMGSLDRIEGVTKLLGFVNAVEDFDLHPYVIDGCSELFHQVLGPGGAHARSAIGVAQLPGRITVEIEAVFSLTDAGP